MTYEEVKTLLGTDGERLTNEGQTAKDDDYLKTYRWYGKVEGAFANMTFLDGKLSAKTYIGLTD
jgi:hypothetical protein